MMATLALLLATILVQQQARGPAGEDDGTGTASHALTHQRCPEPTGPDDIVVCKRDEPDRYRIGPSLQAPPQRRAFDPAFRLPGGAEARVEAVQHDAGITSAPAAMVSLRIPLGHKKKPDEPQK